MHRLTVDESYYIHKYKQDVCMIPPQTEYREDKYGQHYRMKCACGKVTNWHTDEWKAQVALNMIHLEIPAIHQ